MSSNTSEIVSGTPSGTFWDHSGRFLGEVGGGHGRSSGLPDYKTETDRQRQ